MNKWLNALGSALDYLHQFASDLAEKFTGGNSGSGLIMLIFYLVALILVLLLIKFAVRIVKDIFRTIFFNPRKKRRKATNVSIDSTDFEVDINQEPATPVELPAEPEKITVQGNSLPVIDNFNDAQFLDELTMSFDKFKEIDNRMVHPKHFLDTIPPLAAHVEKTIVLSASDKASIDERVDTKSLPELNSLLAFANKEQAEIANKINTLIDDISKAHTERENLAKKELSALNKHNIAVDEMLALNEDIDKGKAELSKDYFERRSFITNIEDKKTVLFDTINDIENDISAVPETVSTFTTACEEQFKSFVLSVQKKAEVLDALKKDYTTLSDSRAQKDERIMALYSEFDKANADKIYQDAFIDTLSLKAEELTKIEKERLAQIEAERIAKEKELREKEQERQAALAAKAKEEAEAKAKAEAEAKAKAAAAAVATVQASAQNKTEKQPEPSVDPDLDRVKEQLKNQAKSSYSLNFENISPAMLEKMVKIEKNKKSAAEKIAKPSDDADATTETDVADDVAIPSESNEHEKPDYVSEIKQQWAEENAHKEQWKQEKARRKEEEQRRKKELNKKLSEDNYSGTNDGNNE